MRQNKRIEFNRKERSSARKLWRIIVPDRNTDLSALSGGWYRSPVYLEYAAFDPRNCHESTPLAGRSCP